MKFNKTKPQLVAVAVLCLGISAQVVAADDVLKTNSNPAKHFARVSDRLIVKLKSSSLATVGVDRIAAMKDQLLSIEELDQIKIASGTDMTEHHMMSSGAHVLSLKSGKNSTGMAQVIAGIAKLPNVEYVEEDSIDTIQFIPNDARYVAQQMWGMMPVSAVVGVSPGAAGSYGADFQTAWDVSSGSGVVIAVVDSGITPHIDIGGPNALVTAGAGSNLISDGYTFISDCRIRGTTSTGGCAASTSTANSSVAPSPGALDTGDYISAQDVIDNSILFPAAVSSSWHGTHVTGTIAAIGNNGISVIGGAYNAKILPVRALGKGGGFLSDISDGILWAAGVHPSIANPYPAKVINLSVGGTSPCGKTQQNAIDAAVGAGAVVVVAAGNENTDAATVHPASCLNVISVAAIAKDGSRASYSNFSSSVPATITLAAPGGDMNIGSGTYDPGIVSTVNSGTYTPITTTSLSHYAFLQGTSMAAPHVSATAALMLSLNPSLTPAQIKSILSAPSSVTTFPSFATSLNTDCAAHSNCGAGVLNANLAVKNSYLLASDVSPADFGTVAAGSSSSKVIVMTNRSASSVYVTGGATISGANAVYFSLVSSTCDSTTLLANAQCRMTVQYVPTSAGSHTAMLNIPTVPISSGVNLIGKVNPPPSSSGGGGGCAIMPFGAAPDISLLIAMLAVAAYWLHRRKIRARGEA